MITVSHNWLTQTTTVSLEPEDLDHLNAVRRGHLMALAKNVKEKCREGRQVVKEVFK